MTTVSVPPATTPQEPLSEDAYLALCVYDEARGQPFEGQRAVARVVLNRARLKYSSDGTIKGTVLSPNQFSGFWFEAVAQKDGTWKYTRVAHDVAGAEEIARRHFMVAEGESQASPWLTAQNAASIEESAALPHMQVEPILPLDAVLYYNPHVTQGTPEWATPEKFIRSIGDHSFYRG